MLTIYWVAAICIIMPVVGVLTLRTRREAEKGRAHISMFLFSAILSAYLVRNVILLIETGGWGGQLVATDDLPLTKFLGSGIVDLVMNMLLVLAIILHLLGQDKTEAIARKKQRPYEVLQALGVEPEALVALQKEANGDMEIHIKIQLVNKTSSTVSPVIQELDYLDQAAVQRLFPVRKRDRKRSQDLLTHTK